MSDKCRSRNGDQKAAQCPCCKSEGKKVMAKTVLSIIKCCPKGFMKREYYFLCPSPNCEVLYYDSSYESIAKKSDSTIRVGFKEREGPHSICYCFGHTAESIANEIQSTGATKVIDSIKKEVKAGRCACDVKNPKGSCCMGDVARVVNQLLESKGDLKSVQFGPSGKECAYAPESKEDHSSCCSFEEEQS